MSRAPDARFDGYGVIYCLCRPTADKRGDIQTRARGAHASRATPQKMGKNK